MSILLWLGLIDLRAAPAPFPAQSLHIVALIDGTDTLRVGQRSATWTHEGWAWATNVTINGRFWNPHENSTFSGEGGILPPELDLSTAVMHVLRGRGTVTFDRDAAGILIHFDDPEGGSDIYEVSVDFAQALTNSKTANDFSLRVSASIDGEDELWISGANLTWKHIAWSMAQDVRVNGQSWEAGEHPTINLDPLCDPERYDFQRASTQKILGRGQITLGYWPERSAVDFEEFDPAATRDFKSSAERLCLNFSDPEGGADKYDAIVRIPKFPRRHVIKVRAGSLPGILGSRLRIYRVGATAQAQSVVPGQRLFGPEGECAAALEDGLYQFEVMAAKTDADLIALRTSTMRIYGPTNIDLRPQPEICDLKHSEDPVAIDDVFIRSSQSGGAIHWRREKGNGPQNPRVYLSLGQRYLVHEFGHSGTNYFAIWSAIKAGPDGRINLQASHWNELTWQWLPGTPESQSRSISAFFPDGSVEIPDASRCRLFTNRRFFTVGYQLSFPNGRLAIFEPRPVVTREVGKTTVILGGPLRPLASAAVLEDESLGNPKATRLSWELTLGDEAGFILDTNASKINWSAEIRRKSNGALPQAPLSPDVAAQFKTTFQDLIASGHYVLKNPEKCEKEPERFTDVHRAIFSIRAPKYRSWNTETYLVKAGRELGYITQSRGQPLEPDWTLDIKWWCNNGAVGGGNSVTMPIIGYLQSTDWYVHPWALTHEMLHNFGYGHDQAMDTLDYSVQLKMNRFRWSAADAPDYVPSELFKP